MEKREASYLIVGCDRYASCLPENHRFGLPAVPLILAELRRELDHWFWALRAITGEDPVPAERRGNMKEMVEIWLEWVDNKVIRHE